MWELLHGDTEVTKKLGASAFGEVSLGILRNSDGTKTPVAIKLVNIHLGYVFIVFFYF